MAVTTKQELIDYCFRELGAPTIRINVADEQVEDRYDEAIEKFREYHWDGIERVYLKHAITQENMDNQYIDVSDSIYGVIKIYPYGSALATNSLFSLEYQLRVQDLYSLTSMDIINYSVSRSHIELLDQLLVGQKNFRFNRLTNKVYLDFNIGKTFNVGDIILVECYRMIDPADTPKMFSNAWLKSYLTALIKRQWGSNLKKFGGMTLPGGIAIDGDSLYREAIEEINELDEEVTGSKSAPLGFMVG